MSRSCPSVTPFPGREIRESFRQIDKVGKYSGVTPPQVILRLTEPPGIEGGKKRHSPTITARLATSSSEKTLISSPAVGADDPGPTLEDVTSGQL